MPTEPCSIARVYVFLIALNIRKYPTLHLHLPHPPTSLPHNSSHSHADHLFAATTKRILHAARSITETLLGALEVAAALVLSVIGTGAGGIAGLLGRGLGVFGLEGAGDFVGGAGDVLGCLEGEGY